MTLRDAVRDYYAQHDLDDAALARLMDERPRRDSRWRRVLIAGGMAATLALAALGLGLGTRALFAPDSPPVITDALPRLIAVQIRADWCPRSPEVGPVFTDLLAQFGNEPVLFITLDITDDTLREQAMLLSETLDIPQAFDEPFESGMIKLIDRENDVLLATITGSEQAEEFEIRIAEALKDEPLTATP